ncbi:MAG TPA: hypothetical protein VGA61_09650 [Anaerolineae bacterium]
MLLRQIVETTNARLLSAGPDLAGEVRSGFASDLMSDVLRFDLTQGLLLTGLTNPQIVRTAEIADASAILMVRGKDPHPETLYLAGQVGIPVFATDLTMFEACGRLFEAGLRACALREE